METSFILEKKIIALCFNPTKESIFLLYPDVLSSGFNSNNFLLTEEDLYRNIILKRYKLLERHECNIINNNFRQLPKDTYEGYSLYFWELTDKLFVVYPFGYILIYDYSTTQLIAHFQCHGQKTYVIRNIVGSPMDNSFFISAENMHNIYHIDYSLLIKGEKANSVYTKLILPKDKKVYDIVAHPNEKFLFVGCNDGIIRVFNYSVIKMVKESSTGIFDSSNNKNNPSPIISLDVNSTGNYLISGTEDGFVYLWDAFLAIKDKNVLLNKTEIPSDSIFSVKFLKSKQFENLQRFVCLTKKGKIYIYFIKSKDEDMSLNKKELIVNLVYENSTFDPIIYSFNKYNIVTCNFLNISYNNNTLAVIWPSFKMEKIKINGKLENYLLFPFFSTKIFFFYNNVFPKINYPLSTQLKYRNYEDYIPSKTQTNFENKIYYADNYFVYLYEVSTGTFRKLVNYTKETGIKNLYLLKFDVKDMITGAIFFILYETDLNKVNLIMIDFDLENNMVRKVKTFDNVNDFIILGNSELNIESDYLYMLGKDMRNGFLFQISTGKLTTNEIDSSALRIYHTPFNDGYCVLYRNVLNELKFSQNYKPYDFKNNNNVTNFSEFRENPYEESNTTININNIDEEKLKLKCSNNSLIKLEFNEREIDIYFNQISMKYFCAISMIDKISLFDKDMKKTSVIKLHLKENPFLTSSIFFIENTLVYSKGNNIYYFYPPDSTNQKICTNIRTPIFISGILSDRYILISQGMNNNIKTAEITTPSFNPLEPLLIGYLDNKNIDYNLVKECVVNMFTNQISQNLINKLIKKDLKEVAWLFISDSKSSFQSEKIKTKLLNELYEFDKILENVLANKDLSSDLSLDEIIWKLNYDQSVEHIKNILIKEVTILIKYGQYDMAIKLLELLGDYPKVLNLLILSSSFEEYEKLRTLFQTKKCLSFTDNLFINNAFSLMSQSDPLNPYKMNHYNKVFDKYEGEHFIFGANQNKLSVKSIDQIKNKIQKTNSKIPNIQKKIAGYGESLFKIFAEVFNVSIKKYETVEICSLILQKIEHYYGVKNTIKNSDMNQKTKQGFQDYTVPLEQLQSYNNPNNNTNINDNTGINDTLNNTEVDQFDLDSNGNIEEISENLYLCVYYHCDKGSGEILEDITDNNNIGKINYINPLMNNNVNINQNMNNEENIYIPDLWSDVLEEFEPLEYEDKWGRKSPGAHSVKFCKENQTKLIISYSTSLPNFSEKFTVELWIKLKDDNVNLLTRDTLSVDIYSGQFKLFFKGKEIPSENVKNYNIPHNKFTHIAILYKKKNGYVSILLDTEEILKFNIKISGINNKSDIIFGNGNLNGELTEIKIWNQKMPISFIKENYKTPLPILAENKRKLKMKINKQDTTVKKKFGFGNNPFSFQNKETTNVINVNNNTNMEVSNAQINPFANEKTNNEYETSLNYPSFSSVMGEKDSFNFGFNENNINPSDNNNDFNFKEEEGFNFD